MTRPSTFGSLLHEFPWIEEWEVRLSANSDQLAHHNTKKGSRLSTSRVTISIFVFMKGADRHDQLRRWLARLGWTSVFGFGDTLRSPCCSWALIAFLCRFFSSAICFGAKARGRDIVFLNASGSKAGGGVSLVFPRLSVRNSEDMAPSVESGGPPWAGGFRSTW